MTKSLFFVAASMVVLAACSTTGQGAYKPLSRVGVAGFNPLFVSGTIISKPDPHFPNVFVTDDLYVVIDQEPIRIKKTERIVTIAWALEDKTPYIFYDNKAIVIDKPPSDLKCDVYSEGKTLACTYTHPGHKQHKYTVTVYDKDNKKSLETLDPWIYND